MKKSIVVIGIALVILIGCIFGISAFASNDSTDLETVIEGYLIDNYGEDDYEVSILQIQDGEILIYYSFEDGYRARTDLININDLIGNS